MKYNAWEIDSKNYPEGGVLIEKLRFFLRYAILAPSSHNTQPWKFSLNDNTILVYIDLDRWLKIADSDKREIYISIGCAIENLLITGKYFGFSSTIDYFPQGDDNELIASIKLHEEEFIPNKEDVALFNAIPQRHTNHNIFEDKSINEEDIESLKALFIDDNIELYITNDSEIKKKVDDLIIQADIKQFSDPEYRNELGYWIGEGVFGTPWLISKVGKIIVKYTDQGKKTAAKDEKELLSASHLAVITSKDNSRLSQIKSGQFYERLALKATEKEIRTHPMSNILELPEIKQEIKSLIPEKNVFPQHTFRLGYAEADKHSPRRDLNEVLIE
jgi:nitroreductase